MAAAALFVALGGPAEAQRLISGSDIRTGTVTTRQIKDRSLETADLSRRARRALTSPKPGSVTADTLAESSVTTRALAPGSVLTGTVADGTLSAADLALNSVGADEVADNAVGQAEIRNNGVGASEIADQSIDGGEVIDGGMLARDVARYAGTLEVRFPEIGPQKCLPAPVTNVAPGVDISKDLILVSASAEWPASLTYTVRNSATAVDQFVFVACNPTDAAVTPPAMVDFRFAIIAYA